MIDKQRHFAVLTVVVLMCTFVLLVVEGCKQSGDGAPMMSDPDRDGSESRSQADIVIENRDLTVRRQPDGRLTAVLGIHNHGNTTTPKFKVIFYAGDPGKKGRKVYPGHHNAGPINPGDTWHEGSLPFSLDEGESEVFAIVDPDNTVEESDETNNKVSQVIPGRQSTRPTGLMFNPTA